MVWRPVLIVLSCLCISFLTPNLCHADLVIATMRGTILGGTLTQAGGGTYDLAGRSFKVTATITDPTDWFVAPGLNHETFGIFAASSTIMDFGDGLTTEFGNQEIGISLYSTATDTENVFQYELGFIMDPITVVEEAPLNYAYFAYGGYESQLINTSVLQELHYDEFTSTNQGTSVDDSFSPLFTTSNALGDEVSFYLSGERPDGHPTIPNTSFTIRAVPEPSSVVALSVVTLALGFCGWRRLSRHRKLPS